MVKSGFPACAGFEHAERIDHHVPGHCMSDLARIEVSECIPRRHDRDYVGALTGGDRGGGVMNGRTPAAIRLNFGVEHAYVEGLQLFEQCNCSGIFRRMSVWFVCQSKDADGR